MEDVSAVTIKDEGGDEQESEDVSEHLTKKTENSAHKSAKDDSTDGDGLFRCLDCGEAFGEEAAYQEHQHEHTHDGPIVCLDSDSQLDGLLVSESGGQRTLCCALCGRKFADSRGFYSHQVKHRNEALKQSTSVLQSTPVAQSTAGPQSTRDQSLVVAKQYVYECEDCGKSYTSMGSFISHTRSHKQASKSVFHELAHLKKKSFECQTCGRCYSRSSALDAHRRCHEVKLIPKSRKRGAEKQPPAEEPASATEDSNKASEQTDRAQENMFGCSCGKTFRSQSGLKTHQRFSHNEKCSPEKLKRKPKKFDCSECEKTFSSYAGMLCHQRYHMKRGGSGGKRFPCEECGKVFTTLTFYYKHQRLAHTEETPAKSFLHQVCQLQKKAFECQECGLRFSRASALQSHRLCHNDVFGQTEKESQTQTSPLPQHKLLLDNKTETETFALGAIVYPQDTSQTLVTERDPCFCETDGDAEADGTDDVNVEVISISASDGSVRDEEESLQELNPDLELLCESDQDGKEEMDAVLCPTEYISSTLKSKPEIDLKIVQIDFPPFAGEGAQTEKVQGQDPPKRFNCPECYRWFTSVASLRSHKLWHRVDGKKLWNPENDIFKCDVCGFDTTHRKTYHNHMRKHDGRKPHKSVFYQLAGLQKNSFKCEVCGKCFSRMSALHSHQQQHPKSKAHPCPDCEKTYSNASSLYNHRKSCHAQTPTQDEVSDTKSEVFNPKTLLGPKVYYCERCEKGFWSLGAYAHHKQNQAQCAHLKEKNEPTVSSHSVNGPPHVRGKVACPVCGKKFRHQGIMKSHMRKHENGNYRCELCSKSFRMFSSLLRHQVVHNAQILPPPIKSFQHQVEQVTKNAYSCPDCGKLFSRAKALKFHMKSHGYETDYSASSPKSALALEGLKCSTCLSHFSNKSSLHTHRKQCGKIKTVSKSYKEDVAQHDTVPKAKKLKCPSCPSLFNNLLSLQYHRKECGKPRAIGGLDAKVKGGLEKVTTCIVKDLVKTTRSNNSGTEKITKSVTEKERGEQKETSESQTLKAATIDTTDLKYKCKECERSFAVVGALNFHKRIHVLGHKSKVKPKLKFKVAASPEEPKQSKKVEQTTKGQFCCPECGRRFISNAALGTHRRWHTDKKFAGSLIKDDNTNSVGHKSVDEGPFQCNKCGKGFFYLCVLRRHQLYYPPCQTKAEPEPAADTSMEGNRKPSHAEFACPECNKTFVKGSLLAAHYESEHNKPIESADLQGDQSMTMSIEEVPEQPATSHSKSEVIPLKKPKLKSNLHHCPHCDMSFLKVRGLRAHKWQAHSQGKKVKSKGTLAESRDSVAINTLATKENELVNESKDLVTENKGTVLKTEHFVTKSKNAVGRRKKGRPGFKSIPCVDCGKRYSSSGALYNHKKICGVLKQEVNPGMAEVVEEEPSPPTRLYEQTIKCLFKCDKCGKAFPTEEQLGTHKDLEKSRPHSCALCCRGYWTETQLQQHLAWHDDVRRRLPTELRYRLSASVSTGPAKLNVPLPDLKAKSSLKPLPTPPSRPQNSHKCQHCGKAFLSPGALHKHEAQHDSDGSYRCSLCPRTFSEIRDLIDHHQECMGDDKGQRDPYTAVSSRDTDGLTCIECGMRFSRELELHQHYIEHARGAYLKLASMRCQDCGQQFTRWEAFKTHLRKHVLEEAIAEEEERRQGIKRSLEMNGSNGNVESAAPEKKQKNYDDGDYEENSDVDVEGDEEDDEEFFDSSWQVRPSEIVTVRPRVAMLSEEEKPVFSSSHRVYACSICGKVYSYLESFRNHQKTHEKEEKKQPTENKCPDCGKVFARPSLLVTHLKVHRPPVSMEPSTLKCDQCVKNFNSLQTYLIHMDLHKQKPFWCLACAKGFRDELSLDKHLQGHNLRRHKCDLCEKSFRVPAELRYHYNTHTGAKPYKCTLCKKNFSQLGNLITHRKKHVGVYLGASKTPLGPRNHLFAGRRRVTEMKRLVFTGMGSTEEAEVIDMLQEHQEEEEEEEEDIEVGEEESGSVESGSESSSEDSGAEESSSGSSKLDSSDSSGSDSSDDSDSSGSGVEEEEQEGKEETALEAHVAVQQKRPKEWECFECGEGFDQESALHLHYMKHASGELPVQ